MSQATAATLVLDRLHIPYRIFTHAQLPESLEAAAMERGQLPSQVVRSILFRRGQGSFFLVLLAGPGQASWRSLRKHLGVSRISMASSKEVLEVTGCEIGTVSPLGITHSPPILADEGVFEHAEISIGSGKRGVAIIMNPHHLKQALHNLELGQFSTEARPADKVSEK